MEFKPGIRVSGVPQNRIAIIDGSVEYKHLSKEMQSFVGPFVENALIPKLEWRKPSSEELNLILSNERNEDDLQIFRIQGDLANSYERYIKTPDPLVQRRERTARYTTTHHKDGKGYGLHFDKWAAPRLFINTGNTERYFCFLNQPIGKLACLLSIPPDMLRHKLKQGKIGHLLAQFPLIVIAVPPSYAWFMKNTKNVLHDGLGQVGTHESFISVWGI